MRRLKNNQGFLTLIALLFVVGIISFLYYINLSKKPTPTTPEEQSIVKDAGIDNTNYGTTLDSMKVQIKNIEQNQADRVEKYTNPGTGENY